MQPSLQNFEAFKKVMLINGNAYIKLNMYNYMVKQNLLE